MTLTPAQYDALQREIDGIRDELRASLGAPDARYIRRMVRIARGLAIAGRGLLMFGLGPISWVAGSAALGLAKILENMEIGHNVMHGQYDWMNDPALDSRHYDWDNVCTAADWKRSHNVIHHNSTNIIGIDRDFGYGMLRMSTDQPWHRRYRVQPLINTFTALLFQYAVGVHDAELDAFRDGKITKEELLRRLEPFRRKMRRQIFKDYVLFPVLGLLTGSGLRVLAGNLVANLMRNLWSNIIIFCGHFPETIRTWRAEEIGTETRGQWYARQIEGSGNIEGSRLLYILSGHLSHQIEHHLFPDIPSRRYPEVQPRIREICARYGLRYSSGTLLGQYWSVLKRVFRYSRPPQASPPGQPSAA